MIHHCTPYRRDKDLGKAYNDCFRMYAKPGDWICLRDIDTLFLTHDAPLIIEKYVEKHPDAGILTCFTNRIGNKDQRLVPETASIDIVTHLKLAKLYSSGDLESTQLEQPISGMLMVISYETWDKIKFTEGNKCLGVDNDYSKRILDAGLKIIRMDDLYIWHTYRLLTGISNTSHLK